MTSVNAELFHREHDPKPCVGRDPLCPCQDGDACHYKDSGDTKAWATPDEPTASELPALLEKHASRLAEMGHYDIAADVQLASERLPVLLQERDDYRAAVRSVADQAGTKICALESELRQFRQLAAKIIEWDDARLRFADYGFMSDAHEADRLGVEIVADAKAPLFSNGECCLTKSASVLPGSEADRHSPSEKRLDPICPKCGSSKTVHPLPDCSVSPGAKR